MHSDSQQRPPVFGVISCPFYVPVVYFPSVSQERVEQSLTALTVLLFCREIIVSQHELKRDCCPWEGEKKDFLEANKCHVHRDDSLPELLPRKYRQGHASMSSHWRLRSILDACGP